MQKKWPMYNVGDMAGRPTKKEAPRFGQRMAALRQQKGLTQTQLAERMELTQKVIDYYERRAMNPTLDVIERVAEALEVSILELLGEEAATVKGARKSGPTGKMQKVFEEVSRLPRRQQEKVYEFVTAFVRQYEQSRQ
jgi:transcriptional regulator with XRE-family HTH domain